MVVGGASTGGRRNGQHVGEILPELGEQEDVVRGGLLDGLIDSWSPLSGTFWVKARLLQAQLVVGPTVGLKRRIPADDDGRGAEDLSCQVSDRVTWH